MPEFRRGAQAAQDASKFAAFSKTEWFSIPDGESIVLRFLTDFEEWIVVDQHNNIKTRGTPPDYKGDKWPQRMGAVCRQTKMANGKPWFNDCWICENAINENSGKPEKGSARVWALACVREEVIGDGSPETGGEANKGKRGYRDAVREVAEVGADGKATGNTTVEKRIIVVNQGFKNFFSSLEGSASLNGTITDRDFWIKRKGNGKDTDYQIVQLDPITVGGEVLRGPTANDPGHPSWAERYATDLDLSKIVEDRASEDHYARFFDTSKPFPAQGGKKAEEQSGQAEPQANKPSNDVDPDQLRAIRDRVMNYDASPADAQPVAAGVADFG